MQCQAIKSQGHLEEVGVQALALIVWPLDRTTHLGCQPACVLVVGLYVYYYSISSGV